MANPLLQSHIAGKSVCFAGRSTYRFDQDAFLKRLQADGVNVVTDVSDQLDYLVFGVTGYASLRKKAEQLNKKSASITIVDEPQFYALLAPTLDEVLELLRLGQTGIDRINVFFADPRFLPQCPNFSGQDFRDAHLRGLRINTYNQTLTNVDLRGADLGDTMLGYQNCQLDGGKFDDAVVQQLVDCSATGVDFSKVKGIGGYGHIRNNDFSRSNLHGVRLAHMVFGTSKFDGADLRGADFTRSNCQGVSMRGADLSGVIAGEASFAHADLRDCKLANANFTSVDLQNANVEGADLTGITLAGANLTGVDFSKTIGFDPASTQSHAIAGPAVTDWLKAGKKARRLHTTVKIDRDEQEIMLQVTLYGKYVTAGDERGGFWSEMGYGPPPHKSADQVLTMIGNRWAGAVPIASTITISATKAGKPTRELRTLAIRMWCELFGVPAPSDEELKEQSKAAKASKQSQFDEWVQILRNDPKGVEKWASDLFNVRKSLGSKFTSVDLSKASLAGWDCGHFDCKEVNFAEADLRKAVFNGTKLSGANLTKAKCQEASFVGAVLKNANCREANFTKAALSFADVCGADLTGAILTDATLDSVKFDADTKFPKGFKPTLQMKWHGEGPSPAHAAQVAKLKAKKPLDIDAFMKRLEAGVDNAKLAKALSMLKADRFKLYAEVTDDHLVGIVKSQGDANLVYSCKLASNGVYGCCTQNLNICGGLRGSLCKHLLVLIVGLAKAGDLDPNTIDTWVLSSRGQKPALDKDSASETFLRYKGAEAGEVDWRPTETIPEDYYAM